MNDITRAMFGLMVLAFLSYAPISHADECKLVMAYKTGGKAALIGVTPDSSGVYEDMFSLAATKIGCKLVIDRLPKRRLHKMLELGVLDFYPGTSFSTKRAKYLSYLPNGLDTAEYGITPSQFLHKIDNYRDVKIFDLTWIMEPGSSKTQMAERYNIRTRLVRDLTLTKVIDIFNNSDYNLDFYVSDHGTRH